MAKFDIFWAENGQEIKIRSLKMSNVREARDFMNACVAENLMLLMDKKITIQEEKKQVIGFIQKMDEGRGAYLVAEADKKIVGICSLERQPYRQNHIAKFGIAVLTDYQGIGIGTELAKRTLKLAKEMRGLEIIELSAFAINDKAIDFYKKLGFKEVARIPNYFKYDGKSVDGIVMHYKP